MKKRILHKLLATGAVAFIFMGGILAQTHNGTAIPGAFANYAGSDVEGTTYIMEGDTVPMWVSPDEYFHPNYNPATSVYTLTDGFKWNFFGTATTNLTVSQVADSTDNYITIEAAAGDAGTYTLSVTEKAPIAFGGCQGNQVDLTINVVEAPSITIGGDATYAFCAGNSGFPNDLQSVITGGWQNYRLAWNLEIATLDADGDKEFYYNDETGAAPTAAQKYAVDYDSLAPQEIATAATAPDFMTVSDFLVIDNNGAAAGGNAVTVYTYKLISINDQASRFGDFLQRAADGIAAPTNADFEYIAAAETVTVTVYPAPVTGPVFHISTNWQE